MFGGHPQVVISTITPPVGIVLFVTARVANLPFDKGFVRMDKSRAEA
jgi:TRAP-type C4-dicarboxylate transport system permease large subunit